MKIKDRMMTQEELERKLLKVGDRVRWFEPHIGYETGTVLALNESIQTLFIQPDVPTLYREWIALHRLERIGDPVNGQVEG